MLLHLLVELRLEALIQFNQKVVQIKKKKSYLLQDLHDTKAMIF